MNRFILLFMLLPVLSFSQSGIDTVFSFTPGTGQNAGQDAEYFPQNIFGFPYRLANIDVPTNDPYDVLSFGLNGEIVIGFKGSKLINIDGSDFIVYENVFKNPATKKLFVEPAIVSVSQDGVNYISFPFDSATLEGCAGISPTLGNDEDYNPLNYGGDGFDIEELGLSYIKYIKIKDITQMLIDNPDHEFYDPILSGFDLDAVVGLNVVLDVQSVDNTFEKPYSISVEEKLITIESEHGLNAELYDLIGNSIHSSNIFNESIEVYSSGVYFLVLTNKSKRFVEKIIIK